jgi:hypothetical protein
MRLPCLLLCALALLPAAARAQTPCALQLAADLPVTWVNGMPVVPATIGGNTVQMLLDTGSDASLLAAATVSRLNLGNTGSITGGTVSVMGGSETVTTATQQDLTLGSTTLKGQLLALLASFLPGPNGQPAADGVIGNDILNQFDVALDLGHNDIRLYTRQSCDTATFPWAGTAQTVPLEHRRSVSPALTVLVDGQPLIVELDTGAAATLLSGPALAWAGAPPESEVGAQAGNDMAGQSFVIHSEEFASFTVGAETFAHVWLEVDEAPKPEGNLKFTGLLGEDYLRNHKLLISTSTQTLLLGLGGQ